MESNLKSVEENREIKEILLEGDKKQLEMHKQSLQWYKKKLEYYEKEYTAPYGKEQNIKVCKEKMEKEEQEIKRLEQRINGR